ncbi:MAG: hypothetical protein O7J95_02020, partial [Planctomycetota bacterium]|nr:hypothetical protein [Planctomycetota bacterium]
GILLFSDENDENSEGFVNSVQVRDVALSPGAITAFGRASAAGIPFNPAFSCPTGLTCCLDQATREVTLQWSSGQNIQGAGWRISRNGVPVRTVPLDTESFMDTAPGPGTFEYTIQLNGGDPALCANLPLTCTVSVVEPGFLFFDDFDCYRTDDDLTAAGWEIRDENNPVENAAWSVANFGNRANPPTEDGTPSGGGFIISDSDAAGNSNPTGSGMSHDIWSPAFSTTGENSVWLHMDTSAVLNNNGKCVFDVDVSTDDGASWTNVFRRVGAARTEAEPFPQAELPADAGGPQAGNTDGFYGRLHLDISEAAADRGNVRFRVRHFEPNDDWWIAVDNVRVDDRPHEGGRQVLLEEGFDGGIPAEWVLESRVDGFAPWSAKDACQTSHFLASGGLFPDGADGRLLHYFADSFVIADGSCAQGPMDELLLTPVLDLREATRAFLHFRSASRVGAQSPSEVLVSLDGGGTFEAEPLFSYHGGGLMHRTGGNSEIVHEEHTIEVPQAVGQKAVVFAFHQSNPGPENSWWAIDDVAVTVESGDAGPRFVRGDADSNSSINLTDGIVILNFLFLGAAAPSCLDAADTDDDGGARPTITDAVIVFSWLFAGGTPPRDPAPNAPTYAAERCGPDMTEDMMDCAGTANTCDA